MAELKLSTSALALEAGGARRVHALAFDPAGLPSADDVTWSSGDPTIAVVSGAGMITGVRAGRTTVVAQSGGRRAAIVVTVATQRSDTVITVLASESLQTMLGWEALAYSGQVECDSTSWRLLKDTVAEHAVVELGIDRIRLEVRSGAENPVDYFTPFLHQAMTYQEWRTHRYQVVNDNDDPEVIDPAGFTFTEIDHIVREVVQPMRQRLLARGESLYVNLNMVAFSEPAFSFRRHPAEVGEFYLAVFLHLQATWGWVPDAVEIVLEPDVAHWTAEESGRALAAVVERLHRAGFRPAIIAPSNTSTGNALQYFRHIIAMPGVRPALTDVAYHRYRDASGPSVAALGALASLGGYRTMMLEHIGADYRELHEDLTAGMSSAWQQYAIASCVASDRGSSYYLIDRHAPRITLGRRTPYLIQYFRWVRRGAVRLEAWSNRDAFDPVAFRNRDGRMVVVVMALAAGRLAIDGLPPGRYGVTVTTAEAALRDTSDTTIAPGGRLVVVMPGPGVLTAHAR